MAAKKEAWIADYHMLIDEGLNTNQIAERMNMTVETFRRRISRYGCERLTWDAQRVDNLIRIWVDRGERFTEYDFPETVCVGDAKSVLARWLKSGVIVKLGWVKCPHSHSPSGKSMCYGVPGAAVRVGRLSMDPMDKSWTYGDCTYVRDDDFAEYADVFNVTSDGRVFLR